MKLNLIPKTNDSNDSFDTPIQMREANPEADCSGSNYIRYLIVEFGVKSLPSIYLITVASIRLYRINHIGIGTYKPSRTFCCKVILSAIVSIMLTCYMIIVIALPSDFSHTAWVS